MKTNRSEKVIIEPIRQETWENYYKDKDKRRKKKHFQTKMILKGHRSFQVKMTFKGNRQFQMKMTLIFNHTEKSLVYGTFSIYRFKKVL